jgi:hypothetical protein
VYVLRSGLLFEGPWCNSIHWDITYTKVPHITNLTLIHTLDHNMFIHWVITYTKFPHITDLILIHALDHNMFIGQVCYLRELGVSNYPVYKHVVIKCMY